MIDFSGLRVKQLCLGAKLPFKGSQGAAGFDLFAPDIYYISAGEQILLNLGIATEMPQGVYGKILDRSGMAWNSEILTMGGVIDNDYRGEWKVILRNLGEDGFLGSAGDRVAQVVFMYYLSLNVNVVDGLQDSVRGEGGFGSTGQ
jgi:dUTP pyrophosphatase